MTNDRFQTIGGFAATNSQPADQLSDAGTGCLACVAMPSRCCLVDVLQLLAVSGRQATADGRELWLVQFYNQAGEHMRTMRVPGSGITGLGWEGNGLRLALSVESHVFFTSVRQSPLWGAFAGTVVYAFSKADRPEQCVMFWGTHSNERNVKYVKRVNHICAAGEFCLLVTKVGPQVKAAMRDSCCAAPFQKSTHSSSTASCWAQWTCWRSSREVE
jgi:hypothetical protein